MNKEMILHLGEITKGVLHDHTVILNALFVNMYRDVFVLKRVFVGPSSAATVIQQRNEL